MIIIFSTIKCFPEKDLFLENNMRIEKSGVKEDTFIDFPGNTKHKHYKYKTSAGRRGVSLFQHVILGKLTVPKHPVTEIVYLILWKLWKMQEISAHVEYIESYLENSQETQEKKKLFSIHLD